MTPICHDPPGCSPWTRDDEGTVAAILGQLPADCTDWPLEPAAICPPDLETYVPSDPDEWIDEVPAAGAWC